MNQAKTPIFGHHNQGGLTHSKGHSRTDLISIATDEDFDKLEKKKKKSGGFLVQEISNISKIMSTTKGRDKICGMIQYLAKL